MVPYLYFHLIYSFQSHFARSHGGGQNAVKSRFRVSAGDILVEDEGGGSVAGETGDMLDDDGEEEDRVGATLSDSSSSEDEPDDEVGSSYSLTQIRYFLFLNNTVPVHTGTLHIMIRNTGCGKIL